MKKQIFLSVATIFAFGILNAQTLNPANRNKAAIKLTKQVKQTTNTKVTAEGQDMNTRADNTITSSYDITALTTLGATAEVKITAMKIESESDANQMSYDSQNPEDGNPQMGSVVQSAMKTPTKITLDANGLITAVKGSEKLELMTKQSATGGGYTKGNLLDVYLKLDKEVKVGDTWKDAIDTKESKINTDYTFKAMEDGLASIETVSVLKLDQKMEQMGMTMFSKSEGKIVATLLVDPATLVIKKKTTTMVLNGTVDAQGQTIPLSVFSTSTETVN